MQGKAFAGLPFFPAPKTLSWRAFWILEKFRRKWLLFFASVGLGEETPLYQQAIDKLLKNTNIHSAIRFFSNHSFNLKMSPLHILQRNGSDWSRLVKENVVTECHFMLLYFLKWNCFLTKCFRFFLWEEYFVTSQMHLFASRPNWIFWMGDNNESKSSSIFYCYSHPK